MGLVRLLGHADRRAGVAALGLAAAFVLPLAAALVLMGLAPEVSSADAITYGSGAPTGPGPHVLFIETDTTLWAALSDPDHPGPERGTFVPAPLRPAPPGPVPGPSGPLQPATGTRPATIPPEAHWVHPDAIRTPDWHVTLHAAQAAPPNAHLSRGADAFEAGTLVAARSLSWTLTLAAMPGAAAVAGAFMAQDARERRPTTALLSALGRPRLATGLGSIRTLLLVLIGMLLAVAVAAVLWFTDPSFRPAQADPVLLAAALLGPAAAAWLTGTWVHARVSRHPRRTRIALAWLPARIRPLALGAGALPALLLAALLFLVEVGVPIGAASVPVVLAGGDDEFVHGDESGLFATGSVDGAPARLLALHPHIDEALAEILLPTMLGEVPVLVRGASWSQAAQYHDLQLKSGEPYEEGDAGIVLGTRLATRHDWHVGDRLFVQATDRPYARPATVRGIFTGGGLLEDEALLDISTARDLADMPPGHVTWVRARPPAAAEAALHAPGRIEVVSVSMPETAIGGGPLRVQIHAANVGSSEASRTLVVRLDGMPQTSLTAKLGAWQARVYETTIVAPDGPFQIDVNPSLAGDAAPGARPQAPDWVQAGVPFEVTIPEGLDRLEVRTSPDGPAGPAHVGPLPPAPDGAARRSVRIDEPGRHLLAASGPAGQAMAWIRVIDPAAAGLAVLSFEGGWTDPASPAPGAPFTLYATVSNVGGVEGALRVDVVVDGLLVAFHEPVVPPGASVTVATPMHAVGQRAKITVAGEPLGIQRAPTSTGGDPGRPAGGSGPGAPRPVDPGVAVARRVFGDADQTFVALAGVAMASGLSIVYLATDRALRDRVQVIGTLEALGLQDAAIRRRATWEACGLAAAAYCVAFVVTKGLFWLSGSIGWPVAFGHVLPDPMGWLLFLQGLLAFAGAAAMAGFLAVGPVLEANPLRGRGRSGGDPLPPVPVRVQLAPRGGRG